MRKKIGLILTLVVLLGSLQVGVFARLGSKPSTNNESDKTIVEVASGNQNFQTLVTALQAAGLVDALNAEGPFTVFAPTNAAFDKLPKETLETLLKPENKEMLVDVLTYHVYAGKVTAEDAKKLDGQEIEMLNGKKAKIKVQGDNLFINDAKVIMPDVAAKNGVIHAIDKVLIPPTK